MKRGLTRREWIFIAIITVSIGIILGVLPQKPSEIEKILALDNTTARSEELIKLLEKVGPVGAQEELLRSGLPFTGETHLLVHTVGDYIYNTYKLDGLQYCRDYFLSACYHGFIINALADYGIEGVAGAIERCKAAPPGVAAQCGHAAGHGFVAWHDYNLVKGAEMCDELGARVEGFAYFNCYDGVFMENVWGVHDGLPSEKRWLSDTDIYYPCTDPRLPEKYLSGCWANQATLIYQRFRGDLRKTALACDGVENPSYRNTCYNNLYRQIHPLTAGKLDRVFSVCSVATGKDRQDECILTNMISYWSVGDREIPFDICGKATGLIKDKCLTRLVGMITYSYEHLPGEKEFYCDKIPDETQRDLCKK
jgi:hypothetical protein